MLHHSMMVPRQSRSQGAVSSLQAHDRLCGMGQCRTDGRGHKTRMATGIHAGRAARPPAVALRALAVASAGVLLIAGCRSTPGPEPASPETMVDLPPDPGWPVLTADTSIEVELPEPFIKLVDLARLRVGMTRAEVLAIFPDPSEIELRFGDEMWQYGFAELIFRDDRLRDWFNIR